MCEHLSFMYLHLILSGRYVMSKGFKAMEERLKPVITITRESNSDLFKQLDQIIKNSDVRGNSDISKLNTMIKNTGSTAAGIDSGKYKDHFESRPDIKPLQVGGQTFYSPPTERKSALPDGAITSLTLNKDQYEAIKNIGVKLPPLRPTVQAPEMVAPITKAFEQKKSSLQSFKDMLKKEAAPSEEKKSKKDRKLGH